MKYILLAVLLSIASSVSYSAETYLSGKITDITSTTTGLYIRMDNGVPSHCEGTPFGWLIIKKEDSVIVSTVLAHWMAGKKSGTVYTSGKTIGSFCTVNQFDPS